MRFRGVLPVLILLAGVVGARFTDPTPSPRRLPASRDFNFQAVQTPGAGREQVLRIQAPSVVVDVIVTDKKGHHVEGLRAGDFSVFENNTPQTIVAFESSATLPESSPPGRSGPSQREQAPSGAEAAKVRALAQSLASVRFVTLVLDTGDLQPGNLKRACDAAAEYVTKVVAPEDFLAVYRVDETLHLVQPFTQDKRQVVDALHELGAHLSAGQMTSMMRSETQGEINELNAKLWGLEAVGGPGPGASGPGTAAGADAALLARQIATLRGFLFTQSTLQARTVFVALRAIAQAYSDIPGRKNVVVFSEGFVPSPEANPQMTAVIDAANRANVAIYVVDASGLNAGFGASSSAVEPTINQQMYELSLSGYEHVSGMNKFDWIKRLGTDSLEDDLGQIAAATGGFVIKNQNDLLGGLAQVDSDLREFYTLVYQPTNTTYDGSFRHIKVVLNNPGYHLRYRLGYWAIPVGEETAMTPAAAQLLAGVAAGSLKSALTPLVNAALLLAPDGQLAAPVKISIPSSRLRFWKDPKRDAYRSSLTMVLVGRDRTGRLVTIHQRFLVLNFTRKELDTFRKTRELEINARLGVPKLEPVDLEAILQFADGSVALGRHELLAEGAPRAGVRLTDLFLTNRVEHPAGPADPSDPLRGSNFELFVPDEPRFTSSDKLTIYFGALQVPINHHTGRPELRLSYVVKQNGAKVMSSATEEAAGLPYANDLVVLKQLNVSRLAPGRYTVEVQAEVPATALVASQRAAFVLK